MKPGHCVTIPAGANHRHGAAKDSRPAHIAIEVPDENAGNKWLEPVDEDWYEKL